MAGQAVGVFYRRRDRRGNKMRGVCPSFLFVVFDLILWYNTIWGGDCVMLTEEERKEHKRFFTKRYKDAHYRQLNLHMKIEDYNKIVAAAKAKNLPVRRYCLQKLLK